MYCGAIRLEQNRYNREPNNAKKEQSIDRSVESFQYDSMEVVGCVSLGGAGNTIYYFMRVIDYRIANGLNGL